MEKKKAGRPKGSKTKNIKDGVKAGRPILEVKKITKSIVIDPDMVQDIEKIEAKSFSEKIRVMAEFYFKNH